MFVSENDDQCISNACTQHPLFGVGCIGVVVALTCTRWWHRSAPGMPEIHRRSMVVGSGSQPGWLAGAAVVRWRRPVSTGPIGGLCGITVWRLMWKLLKQSCAPKETGAD
jgi:hypothetical protein